jgi:hypothetical protein
LNLSGNVGAKHSRLHRGRIRTDHDFTMLKCENIGRAWNAAELFMQGGHSPIAHNQDMDLVKRPDLGFWAPASPSEFASNSSEALQIACRKQHAALTISDSYQWRRT